MEGQPCWLPRRNHALLKTKKKKEKENCIGTGVLGVQETLLGKGLCLYQMLCQEMGRRASSSGTPTFPSLNSLLSLASPPRAQSLPPTEPAATMEADYVYAQVSETTSTS